jgi:hypothetical protein
MRHHTITIAVYELHTHLAHIFTIVFHCDLGV